MTQHNGKTEEHRDNDNYAKNFTRVPNILFESYKYLTKEEILLYIRLRYVYWDTKPRYFSLRDLADITGYSTGALSKMLPRLTTVGLVHAEIKRKKGKDGKEKGNPLYHITINDIWEENRKFFTEGYFDPSETLLIHQMNETCSPNEQDNPKPVHQMNKPVHKMNDPVHQMRQGCSPNEHDQAQNDAYKITNKTNDNTSLQDESNSNIPDTHTFVSGDTARADSLSQLLESWKQGDEQEQQENLRVLQEAGIVPFETPQGDDHAVPAAGHSHRVDDAAARGDDTSHPAMDSGQVAPPEGRPVLETQEVDEKGEHHATVPTVPATNPAAPRERAVSWSGSDHSRDITHPGDDLPVVRAVGSVTPGPQAGRHTSDAGKDRTAQVTQTPPTPMPAQSLSLPQAEQAALGQSPKSKGKKQAEPKPETPKGPPVAPPSDMAWGTRKCLLWFDYWRGGILIGKWKLMQASTCAKGLAEQFDEQTVIQARTDMEADPYYAAKGGCDVCDVANNIHKYLKRRQSKQQPAIQPALKVVKRYSSYDDPNFRSDQDFYPVEGGSYATASR